MGKLLNESLLEGISNVDISPTMFEEATGHYQAIAKLFEENGLNADFYPQGSFSTGTVVRPYNAKDEDTFYDLDMVCLVKDVEKHETTPDELMGRVTGVLLNHGTYKDKCRLYPQCVTIEYARNESRPGFNLDIVVGVRPSGCDGLVYALRGIDERWACQDLSLAKVDPASWMGSNPHALTDWFHEKNRPFSEYNREARLKALVKSSKGAYATIEQVPDSMDRSSLQRAIQIAKRARDIYYSHVADDIRRPESCMLLSMLATHAEKMPEDSSAIDILRSFCSVMHDAGILADVGTDCLVMRSGKPYVGNPVFPENYLDGWTKDDLSRMFGWLSLLGEDLAVDTSDSHRFAAAVQRMLGSKTSQLLSGIPAVSATIPSVAKVKPWGLLVD